MSQKKIDSLKAFHQNPKKIGIDDNLQITNDEFETTSEELFEESFLPTSSLTKLHEEMETLETDFSKFVLNLEKVLERSLD